MKILDFDMWFDRYGSDYANSLYDWFGNMPESVCLSDLIIGDIDDFVGERILYEYESYTSEFEDRAYNEWKDEKCF